MLKKILCVAALAISSLQALASDTKAPHQWQHILILNDINGAYGSVGYTDQIKRLVGHAISDWQVDAVISPGDLVAGQSLKLTNTQINAMWQGFKQQILTPFQQHHIQFYPALGNHDGSKFMANMQPDNELSFAVSHYKFSEERHIAEQFWLAHPPQGITEHDRFYPYFYRVVLAGHIFVFIDASGHYLSDAEFAYLEHLLQQRRPTQNLFVVGHLPLVGIAKGRNKKGEVLLATKRIRQLFQQYRVTAYISGHQHAFYPSQLDSTLLINSGGFPARSYVGSDAPATERVSILSVTEQSKQFFITTFDANKLTLTKPGELPIDIEGYPMSLRRYTMQPFSGFVENSPAAPSVSISEAHQ